MRKFEFAISKQNGMDAIKYMLGAADVYDDRVAEKASQISSVVPFQYVDEDGKRSITSYSHEDSTLTAYMKNALTKEQVICIVNGLVSAFEIGSQGIPVSYIIKDSDYVFVNKDTYAVKCMLLPIKQDVMPMGDIPVFFRDIVSKMMFEETPKDDYVARMLTIINSVDFSVNKLKAYIHEQLEKMNIVLGKDGGIVKPMPVNNNVKVNKLGVMNNMQGGQPYGQPPMMNGQQPPMMNGQPPMGGPRPMGQQPPMMNGQPPMGGPRPMGQQPPMMNGQPPMGGPKPMGQQPPMMNGQPPMGGPKPMGQQPPMMNGQSPMGGPKPMGQQPSMTNNGMPIPKAPVPAMTSMPEAPKPAMPEAPKPAMPEAPKPAMPEAPKPVMPEAPKPVMPEAPKPAMPEAPKPVMPEAPKPVMPEAPKPAMPEAPKPVMQEKPAMQEMEHGSLVGKLGNNVSKPVPHIIRKKTGEVIYINKPEFAIGKSKTKADYPLEDNNAISRVHCIIVQHNGVNYIKDNHSTNHTFLNGNELEPEKEVLLTHKSVIQMGDEEFTFLLRKGD